MQITLGALGLTSGQVSTLHSDAWNGVVDFFRDSYLQADQEQRTILINNYWQLLWRASRKAGLSSKSPLGTKLDSIMGQWWDWKMAYDAAVLRRWVPFTHDWSKDQDVWADRWISMVGEIDRTVNGAVSGELEANGVDLDALSKERWDRVGANTLDNLLNRFNQALSSDWFWPAIGVGAAMFTVSWLISTGRILGGR